MPNKIYMTFVNKSTDVEIQRILKPRQFVQPINNVNERGISINFMGLTAFKTGSSCKSCRGG